MDHNRTRNALCLLKDLHHGFNVMAVERTYIFKSQVNKEIVGKEQALYSPLEPEHQFPDPCVEIWNSVDDPVHRMPETVVCACKCKP